MWEEKENGSDNALCHSYYTSQLLRPMRTLEVTGIICLSKNAGPVPQPVCSHVIWYFVGKYLSSVEIISLCLQFLLCWGYIKCTHCREIHRGKRAGNKQVERVRLCKLTVQTAKNPQQNQEHKVVNMQYYTISTNTKRLLCSCSVQWPKAKNQRNDRKTCSPRFTVPSLLVQF